MRRVAVLDVVALRVARAPQLVQVAGHRARRAHDDVARAGDAVDDAEHLALRGQRAVAERVGLLDGGVPLGGEPAGALGVVGVGGVALQRAAQLLQALASVADERQAGVLERVHARHVEVDEPRVLGEQRARGGREVAPARADAEDHVGLAGDRVRGGRAGGADRAERLRVVVGQRALAGLRLRDRDAGGPSEGAERVGRLGVDRAAAGDDQRAPRAAQQLGGLLEHRGLDRRAPHVPDTALEQLLRPVERLRLHVLRQREADRAGLRGVGQHAHGGEQRRRRAAPGG